MMTSSKQNVDSALAEFDGKRDALLSFCQRTKDLVEQILQDAGISFHSVQARVKNREKLKQKYVDPEKNYTRLDDITDQAGLRIITYYGDEIDRAGEVIKKEFEIDSNNSVDKRGTEPDKFGYYALSYVCKYSGKRTSQAEYKKFADIWCEIQITSILRHTWSEIEHAWYDLKRAYPDDIKRRFARMAALMEIAEDEFLNLRKIRSDYQRSMDVQVEAKVPGVPVDAVSLRSFIQREPLVARLDKALAEVLGGRTLSESISETVLGNRVKSLTLAGISDIQHLRLLLEKYQRVLIEFARQCTLEKLWPSPPAGQPLSRAVCIAQLAQLTVSLSGVKTLAKFQADFGIKTKIDLARQVAVAKRVVAEDSA